MKAFISTKWNALLVPLLLIQTLAISAEAVGETCLVLPAYNEEARLPLQEYFLYLKEHKNVRLLFVNDGSTDGTRPVLENLKMTSNRIQLLNLEKNQGKAEASRLGMLHAMEAYHCDIVGFWDSDLATPLSEISRFIEVFDSHPKTEMVFGARVALLGRDINRFISRHYLGRVFATLTSIVLNLRIYDTQCGAKMFRVTEDLKLVLKDPFESRWIFDVEILARFLVLFREGKSPRMPEEVIYELPLLSWRDIAGSKLKLWDKLSALEGLATIYKTYFSPWKSWPSTPDQDPSHSEL